MSLPEILTALREIAALTAGADRRAKTEALCKTDAPAKILSIVEPDGYVPHDRDSGGKMPAVSFFKADTPAESLLGSKIAICTKKSPPKRGQLTLNVVRQKGA